MSPISRVIRDFEEIREELNAANENGLQLDADSMELEGRVKALRDQTREIVALALSETRLESQQATIGQETTEIVGDLKSLRAEIAAFSGRSRLAESRIEEIDEILRNLSESEERPSEADTESHIRFSEDHTAAIELLTNRVGQISDSIDNLLETQSDFRDRHGEFAERAAAEKEAEDRIRKEFNKVTKRLRGRWSTRLPDLEVKLTDSAPDYLSVTIAYVDDQTDLEERREDVQLTKSFLQQLPNLFDDAFKSSYALMDVSLTVSAMVLDYTGNPERTDIATYPTSRTEWRKLRRGKYSDDWQKLLSTLSPAPIAPGGSLFEGSVGIVVFIFFFILCLALVFIGRKLAFQR